MQAFEFNERAECPRFVQNSIVEILGNGMRFSRCFDPVVPVFNEFRERAGCESFLDLCSGSGEPVSLLLDGMERKGTAPPRFSISDLIPNIPAMERVAARHPGRIDVIRGPVDATDVPEEFDRQARIIVNALHHFSPPMASRILEDCVAKGRAVFVFEAFPRDIRCFTAFLPYLFTAYFANPILTRRDRLLKGLFSYSIPVIGSLGMWDAGVSLFRIHTREELTEMVRPFGGRYRWEYREVPYFPNGRAVVFFGMPG